MQGLFFCLDWSDPFVSQTACEFYTSHFLGLWFVNVPFVGSVKFKSLARFPVDQPSYAVMLCFVSYLSQFATFTNYVISRFISVST